MAASLASFDAVLSRSVLLRISAVTELESILSTKPVVSETDEEYANSAVFPHPIVSKSHE